MSHLDSDLLASEQTRVGPHRTKGPFPQHLPSGGVQLAEALGTNRPLLPVAAGAGGWPGSAVVRATVTMTTGTAGSVYLELLQTETHTLQQQVCGAGSSQQHSLHNHLSTYSNYQSHIQIFNNFVLPLFPIHNNNTLVDLQIKISGYMFEAFSYQLQYSIIRVLFCTSWSKDHQ